MKKTEFDLKFKEYTDAVNARLDSILKISDVPYADVFEAMKYSLSAGGKRIRPVLVMAVAEMLIENCDNAKKLSETERAAIMHDACYIGCAIECIHTYSLIHDDLPCMDDDDLRRGKPSCHIKFGESTALLAGDALLNSAFEILSDLSEYSYMKSDKIIKIIFEISKSSGADGMIGGQIIDLASENMDNVPEERLTLMHSLKTGAMLKAPAVCGAIMLGADEQTVSHIESFAKDLGLAFQIKDDILDCMGNEAVLGKPVGTDTENGKTTYVSLYGMEGAISLLEKLTKRAEETISKFEGSDFLVELSEFLLSRKY